VFIPVPRGVVRFEGSSLVNIVAEEGEIRKREVSVAIIASLKPRTADPLPTIIREDQSCARCEGEGTARIVRWMAEVRSVRKRWESGWKRSVPTVISRRMELEVVVGLVGAVMPLGSALSVKPAVEDL